MKRTVYSVLGAFTFAAMIGLIAANIGRLPELPPVLLMAIYAGGAAGGWFAALDWMAGASKSKRRGRTMNASEGSTNASRGGGLRSRDIPEWRRQRTRAEIEAKIREWEGTKALNTDDPKTCAACDRALELYRKQLAQPRLPEGA